MEGHLRFLEQSLENTQIYETDKHTHTTENVKLTINSVHVNS